MAGFLVTCTCGHEMWVTASSIGGEEKCGHCGATIAVTDENTVCYEDDTAEAAADTDESGREPEPTCCVRCGKPFKGDWDRYPTDEGTYCHICANLAGSTVAVQRTPAAGPDQHSDGLDQFAEQVLRKAELERAIEGPSYLSAGRRTLVRIRLMFVAGLVLIAVLVAVRLAGHVRKESAGTDLPEIVSTEPDRDQISIDPWRIGLGILIALAPIAAMRGVALYLTLDAIDKLPNETVGKNVVAVGLIAACIGLPELMFPYFIGCAGGFVGFFIGLWIVGEFYDFGISDYFTYVLMSVLVLAFTGFMNMLVSLFNLSHLG